MPVGGNIGAPLSAQVDESTPDTLHVVEASSFQLEQIDTFHPWIAVMLNFSPDHLDRHPTSTAYARGQGADLREPDARRLGGAQRGRPGGRWRWRGAAARAARCSRRRGAIDDGIVVDGRLDRRPARRRGDERLVPLTAIHLLGPHLVDDVMAAATVGAIAGVAPAAMTARGRGVPRPRARDGAGAEIGGVRFVNDSKATNVEAALRSIESFDRGLVRDHRRPVQGRRLRGCCASRCGARAQAVVAIGEARAAACARRSADVVPVHEAASMADAVRTAFDAGEAGGVVLLAPACSSFDMFRDYAERGRRFKEEVARLAASERETASR